MHEEQIALIESRRLLNKVRQLVFYAFQLNVYGLAIEGNDQIYSLLTHDKLNKTRREFVRAYIQGIKDCDESYR